LYGVDFKAEKSRPKNHFDPSSIRPIATGIEPDSKL
jgi:hypothetical protein